MSWSCGVTADIAFIVATFRIAAAVRAMQRG